MKLSDNRALATKTPARVMFAMTAAFVVALLGGCTDEGDGLLGSGPDDRKNRGGGPDTISVIASADTYFENTIDKGGYLLAGELPSAGFQAVTFLSFESLPASGSDLEEAHLILYVAQNKPPYSLRISRLEEPFLEEPPPSEFPFWPGPPDGSDFIQVSDATAVEDTTTEVEGYYFLKIEIPVQWIEGWISDPASNYGLRVTGGQLDVDGNGRVERRFWAGGQTTDDEITLDPRIETLKTGEEDPETWSSTEDFFIYKPSLGPVGDLSYMQLGCPFGYGLLLRFEYENLPELASINRALLTLKVDRSQLELNEGVFGMYASAVVGAWKEDSTNVNVELDPAVTEEVEVDASEDGDDEVVLDVTALVELFAEAEVFEVAVIRSGLFSYNYKVAFNSSGTLNEDDAPVLKILFTTPPGGRFSP